MPGCIFSESFCILVQTNQGGGKSNHAQCNFVPAFKDYSFNHQQNAMVKVILHIGHIILRILKPPQLPYLPYFSPPDGIIQYPFTIPDNFLYRPIGHHAAFLLSSFLSLRVNIAIDFSFSQKKTSIGFCRINIGIIGDNQMVCFLQTRQ